LFLSLRSGRWHAALRTSVGAFRFYPLTLPVRVARRLKTTMARRISAGPSIDLLMNAV
jgi:hypothetical protein